MNQKNVIVTGGAGFIGSSFVRRMIADDYRVLVLDKLTYAGKVENLTECLASNRCELVQGDIGDFELTRKLLREHQPVAVFNFAAESHVDNSIRGPAAFIQTNILGTFTLLEALRAEWPSMSAKMSTDAKAKFRFVHVSTDEVYGQLGDEGYFTEESRYSPNSPYSASKAAADHLVSAWYHTYGLPTMTTNCSNNYGPRQYPEKLIPVVILSALAGKNIPVYGRGLNVRDWIHVEDHCQGIALAFERGTPGSSYCFGGRSERKNIDVVSEICRQLDTLRPRTDGNSYLEQISYVQDRAGHDFRYAIDDSKAQRELGYKLNYGSFEVGLKQTVEWYLQNQPWIDAVLKK